MRCSHCHSGRMKRAENFGAERMQCGSCGILTKSAETRVTDKQQELINYLSGWPAERIENAWEVTQDLDQNGIGKAINMSRSNVPRLVEPLVTAGLVRKKKAHILDENNRVTSRVKKWVYYLTREGRQQVTESRRAETFEAEEPFICPECRRASTKSKTSQVCVRCESEYQSGLNPPMRVPWPGDDGYYAETFEANWFSNLFGKPEPKEVTAYEMQREIIGDFDYESISTAQRSAGTRLWEACFYACLEEGLSPEKAQQLCNSKFFRKLNPSQVVPYLSQTMRPFVRQYLNYTDREGKSYREAYFEAHEGGHMDDWGAENESNGDQVKLFYEGIYTNDDEDDKREGQEIRSYSLISKKEYIDYYHDTKYDPCKCDVQGCLSCFLDEASHTPAIKNGGISSYGMLWFEDAELNALDAETFEAPNRYPVRPTRPSEDWPRPTPRPRRPNRRPNPRPRPARRPF